LINQAQINIKGK